MVYEREKHLFKTLTIDHMTEESDGEGGNDAESFAHVSYHCDLLVREA